MKYHFFALCVLTALTLAKKVPLRYDDFQVHRVTPQTFKHIKALHHLQHHSNGLNFWTDASTPEKPVDILVPPHLKYDFEDFLEFQNLDSEVLIENVQELINHERARTYNSFGWNNYHTLKEINTWLKSLSDLYPGIVTNIIGGESYEGREIIGVKISFKPGNKGVFLEGGIHAREWISPATVTFIANQLLTNNNSAVREVAESRDWYVFPIVNPDGYVYTLTDRLWRKNRKPYETCVGADLNRNWGYHWMHGGASSSECEETYAGNIAFSEIESRTLASFISTIAKDLDIYLSFHAYSQLLLIPFGHAGHEIPQNNAELLRIGNNAVDDLSLRYGTLYTVGNIPEALNQIASGSSSDWVLGTYRNVRLVYTFELRDTGRHGFLLPPEQIIPTGEETLDAIVSIVQQADTM